jgi:hypothetical protein
LNLLHLKSGNLEDHLIDTLPHAVPTGFGDNQLYDLGLIANDKPFEEIYMEARIDEKIRGGTYSF